MSRNLAASIRTRLKQHADAAKQDFNLTLTHYGLERLLYLREPPSLPQPFQQHHKRQKSKHG